MAMEFYRQLRPDRVKSAGTAVDLPGQKLKDRGPGVEVVTVMKELRIDMSENKRTQLTPAMLDDFDKVVVIAEPQTIPAWLQLNPKIEIWDVEDARGKTLIDARIIRDEIKERVTDLDDRLNGKA